MCLSSHLELRCCVFSFLSFYIRVPVYLTRKGSLPGQLKDKESVIRVFFFFRFLMKLVTAAVRPQASLCFGRCVLVLS